MSSSETRAISDLSHAGSLQSTDKVPVLSGGSTLYATAAEIAAFGGAGSYLPLAGGSMTGAVLLDAAGTVSLPALSFVGDTNTGLYRIAADRLGVTAGGVLVVEIGSSYMAFGSTPAASGTVRMENGTALRFRNGANSGDVTYLSSDSSNNIFVGTNAAQYNMMAAAFRLPDGSVGTPAVGFQNDTNTGFYRSGADTLVLVVGGAAGLTIGTTIDAASKVITAVGDATAATHALNRQTGDARYFLVTETELAALAGLTSAADRLPYFTGSGAAALATYTAYGRTITAVADQAALTALIAAATASLPGAVELATEAEVRTGTDTTRAVTPATLAAVKPGSVLDTTIYDPGTTATYTTTSATLGDIDATNLSVTFTAPASGNVLVFLDGRLTLSAAATMHWGLRDTGGTQAGGLCILQVAGAALASQTRAGIVSVTGLTPGTSYTYRWAWKVSAGATFTLKAGQTAGDEGAASMMVVSA